MYIIMRASPSVGPCVFVSVRPSICPPVSLVGAERKEAEGSFFASTNNMQM